ncbi:hypothetical protein BVRB_4g079430 [Beta vulgaris subsp. vulgaris]|nr:hypothetical protein BVRB_4g079430 [Beta vulgaris subsp. vulgaris]
MMCFCLQFFVLSVVEFFVFCWNYVFIKGMTINMVIGKVIN